MVCANNGVLFSLGEEGNSDIHCSMDELEDSMLSEIIRHKNAIHVKHLANSDL